MSTAQPHRVRRLALAVQGVESADEALAWQQALHDGLDGAWRSSLDAALDAAAARAQLGDRTWRVPRLHLRLRAREPQALAAAFGAAIDEALAGQVSPAAPALQSEAERAAAAFEHHLATGRVPWHDDEADAAVVARTLRAAAQRALDLALSATAWPSAWVQRASEGAASAVLQRWVALLDEPAIERLRSALTAAGGAASATEAPGQAPAPRVTEAARCLWLWWQQHAAPSRDAQPDPAAPELARTRMPVAASVPSTSEPVASRSGLPAASIAPPEITRGATMAADDQASAGAWWAHDAGLVLLHPFLPTLLRATSCAVDDALIPAQLPRAATLLHALATGRNEAFEFELTLAKLMLGLAPDAPLPPGALAIDAAARAEGHALLEAAVRHWPALGGTGVEAFRAAFVAREGSLSRHDDGWHLRVVEEPFDVLLGRLPWGIGLVRLPWMDAPLHVHWGTWGA